MTPTPTASPEHAPTAAPALVTLIVPGFDVEPYALEALDSLRAQSLTSWRAVLVDDASSDRTGEIFARAATEDGRFQVVTHDRRRGLGAARNTGLDRVDSEYLGFLDADDLMRPDALRRMVGMLQRSGSDFVAGAYVRLRPHPDGSYTSGEVQPWVSAATDPARERTTIEAHPEATSNIVAWSKLSRASFWTRTGLRFPEGRLYEDQLVAQRMYAQADAFDVLPDVVVDWRVRADGSSITQREAALPVLHDCLRAMRDGLGVLEDGNLPRAALARRRQIARMDLPRLVQLATEHADAAYRRAVAEFTQEIWPDTTAPHRDGLDEPSLAAIDTATRW